MCRGMETLPEVSKHAGLRCWQTVARGCCGSATIQNKMLIAKPFYMCYEMFVFTFFRPCNVYLLIGYCIYTFFNERCIMSRLCSYTTSGCDFCHNLQMKQDWVWTVIGWATAALWRVGVWVTNLYLGAVAGSFWLEVFFSLSPAPGVKDYCWKG